MSGQRLRLASPLLRGPLGVTSRGLRPLGLAPRGRSMVAAGAPRDENSTRDWQLLPSGTRWTELAAGDDPERFMVQDGQTVRVAYTVRLDDGSELISQSTASFRIGSGSVCAALDEGTVGMRLGDRRRLRAPPASRRGKALSDAPRFEFLEYDIALTGAVHHMRIETLDERQTSADPLDRLLAVGKRAFERLVGGTGK